MGELSNTISVLSAILFLASTAINIYLTMRLSKFENQMNKFIDDRVKEVEQEVLLQAKEAKVDARAHVLREIEIISDRLNRMDRKIDKQ